MHTSDPPAAGPRAPRILVADDQADVLEALCLLLRPEGFDVESATSPAGVRSAVEASDFDVLLLDLNYARDTTSGREGLDLLRHLQQFDPTLPVAVMTAWGSVEGAVEAMRHGARDYVTKPWDNARLLATLRTQVELSRALRAGQRLRSENQLLRAQGAPEIVAGSRPMRMALEMLDRVSRSDATVLLTGEHGTGKEVAARRVHAASARSAQQLITVNVGGLSEGVFESELFGHVKGAFTGARDGRIGRFEMADGGTLFLDEIANVPLGQQAKLLRVIQSGELERVGSSHTRKVDVRLICATNADLAREVAEGRFREDLLFRINTVEVRLPPLRDRAEDIPLLASHFLTQHSGRYAKKVDGFEPAAIEALVQHPWPGNVRELDHAIHRAVLLCAGPLLRAGDFSLQAAPDGAPRLEQLTLLEAERHLVQRALKRHEGNVSAAAESLGLSRSALYRRLKEHGL